MYLDIVYLILLSNLCIPNTVVKIIHNLLIHIYIICVFFNKNVYIYFIHFSVLFI